jgi:glycosyltransferase involved in cell wall biosynthesis
MIIGIDGNEANVKEKVGVHQYSFHILWGLYEKEKGDGGKNSYIIYLKKPPREDLPPENKNWKYKIIRGKGLWILTRLMPHLLKEKNIDVFFTPSHYLPPLMRVPGVCTIHDLGYLKFSGQFKKYDYWQLRCWTAISLYISKYIIAVSESTKKDIVRHYPFASKKIEVIHHGYEKKVFNTEIDDNVVRRAKKKYKVSGNYLLFLSMLKPSKNIGGLIDAYAETKGKIGEVKLVIAGKKGWLYENIFEKVKKLGLENDVIFTDYIHESDKRGLIKGAKAFVLPSFWEGFGMDVINALACGTPVIVSKVASLPEVAGDAGIYMDPDDKASIAKAIRKVLLLPQKEYNILIKAGLKQAKRFSWEKSARETLKVLNSAGLK